MIHIPVFRICIACVLVASSLSVASAADKPNIVILLADDLGFSDLGCYGSEIATPHLDGLASGGLRFTQFYNTARCWPTRGALLTGYYAQQVRRDKLPGIRSGAVGARPAWARLLPEMLEPLGYRTYHSGKWHVDGMPLAGGFDRSYLLQDQGRFFSPKMHYEDDQKLPPVERDSGYYATTAIADHALRCLREHAEQYADRPFFHYVAFTSPHFPLQALQADVDRYRQRYREGWQAVRQARYARMKELGIVDCPLSAIETDVGPPYAFPEAIKQLGPGEVNRPLPWESLTDEQRDFQAVKMAIHAAMIDRMDREIGRLLDQLRAMNALDNTLIFFLSDNGASAEIMVRDDGHDPSAPPGSAATHLCLGPGWSTVSNTPLRRHKTWVHEGGISTPLIVHWPQGIAARGELRRTVGHVIDLVPTVLEIAGGRRPETWQGKPVPAPPGKTLAPSFAAEAGDPQRELWWLHEGNRALRLGIWKIVASGEESAWELYDLGVDRCEQHNLATAKPETLQKLADRWRERFDEFQKLASADLIRSAAALSPLTLADDPQLVADANRAFLLAGRTGIHRQPIKMVKAADIGPARQVPPPQLGKALGKIAGRSHFARQAPTARHHTPLARIRAR